MRQSAPPYLPPELWDRECRYIHQRRTGELPPPDVAAVPPNRVGLALSGGGIRSATLSLGVLQALAKLGILPFIDYLSTVSGGGYIGTTLGGLFQRWKVPDPPPPASPAGRHTDWERVKTALTEDRGHPIDWLRENGRFLAPNGAGDMSLAAAVVVRNIVAVHVVLGTLFVAILLCANGVRRGITAFVELWPSGAGQLQSFFVGASIWWSPVVVLVVAMLLGWVLPLGIAYWLVRTDEMDGQVEGQEAIPPITSMVFLILLGAVGIGAAARGAVQAHTGQLAAATVLICLLSLLAWFLSLRLPLAKRANASGRGLGGRLWRWIARPTHGSAPARAFLTLRLRSALVLTGATALYALVDTTGQTVYVRWLGTDNWKDALGWIAGGFSAFAGIGTIAQRFAGSFAEGTSKRPRVPMKIVAALAAGALVVVILTSLSAFGHWLTWMPPDTGTEDAPAVRYQIELPEGGNLKVSEPGTQTTLRKCLLGSDWGLCTPEQFNLPRYFLALGLALAFTVIFRWMYSFVNRSSLASLYAARLARAFLGASNPARDKPDAKSLSDLLDNDDLDLVAYRPYQRGGPLPIVNVTVNETMSGRSQVEQRDRKGMGLAIGPAGISVGVRHHACWEREETDPAVNRGKLMATVAPSRSVDQGDGETYRVFPGPQQPFQPSWPTVGRWMAISGAAVSTGLGSRTSIGLSLLIGLFNLRLGHWWRSGVDPRRRQTGSRSPSRMAGLGTTFSRALPVQSHLFQELLARFPGTSERDWYLSDGGHFENTGVYELVRRRVPFIVLCDNGADTDRTLEDLGGLVRKARTDFGAHIQFLTRDQLAALSLPAGIVGTLEDLGFAPTAASSTDPEAAAPAPTCYATLARISYDGDSAVSTLLVLRPAVLGTEPADVLNYRAMNPSFPQQSTGDQFFDEAQWESYRRLGEYMATAVFSAIPIGPDDQPASGWRPPMVSAVVAASQNGGAAR